MFSRFSKLSRSRIDKIVPFKRAKDAELADKLQKTNHRVVLSKSTTIFKALTIQKSDYDTIYQGKSRDSEKKIDKYLDREVDLIILSSTGTNLGDDFSYINRSEKKSLSHNDSSAEICKGESDDKVSSLDTVQQAINHRRIISSNRAKKILSISSRKRHILVEDDNKQSRLEI